MCAQPKGQWSLAAGEVSPSLYGRPDLARFHSAASTMRNVFVKYSGGGYSRAGTSFVGFSKQTGRAYPPRLLTFQFSINQGLCLEFGNLYMRVISDGAYAVDEGLTISNITQASPGVMTTAAASGGSTATANTGAVAASYAPGEIVTLAGGVYSSPAQITVTNTKLLSAVINAPGTGYVPADTLQLTGGVQSTPAVLTVATTQVVSATIAAAGAGGTNGTQTVTGTTGTGTKFQASVTVAGGIITAVLSITVGGAYTVNPAVPANEPVTGAGLVGAQLSVVLGIRTVTATTPGVFTTNPPGLTFTQASTSGVGTGATFRYALLAPNAVTVSTAGVYTSFPANPVAQASTTGSGVGVTFTVVTTATAPFSTGDWVALDGIVGMTGLNGSTAVVTQLTPTTYSLADVYGAPLDTTVYAAYSSGGVASRIYTLTTPYAEADLKYMKMQYSQSADVLTICCVNVATGTEYIPQDLRRLTNTSWTFTPLDAQPTVTPPVAATMSGIATNTGSVNYSYVVTSVDPVNGTESVASGIRPIPNAVDIAATAGSMTISWEEVPGVNQYNVYKAAPCHSSPVPAGALYGFAGTVYGTRFVDNNVVADFSQVPPTHHDPFARGEIIGTRLVSGGAGYLTATASVTSGTGTGADIAVSVNTTLAPSGGAGGGVTVSAGPVGGFIIKDGGKNYTSADTLVVSGDGTGATGTLDVGPSSGTYPSVASYFQQRRVYASTLNNPDTYFMSQPGAYTNFDYRIPTVATDAITGTPWAVQVNGIQWMVPMPAGLLCMTGLSAWLLAGVGSFATNVQAITPSTQDAIPQAFTGCSPTIPPIKINYDILYVESNGALYYDLPYQMYALSEPLDLTETSTHLFTGFTTIEHAWCEQPNKVLWSVRSDGVMRGLTFLKAQQIAGWSRHDTQGLFVSCAAVREPPVDALYVATQRYPGGKTAYMVERQDNHLWDDVEDVWAVDCGLRLGQATPNATITASSATGLGAITGYSDLVGGTGYSAFTTATIVDDNGVGPGAGATATLAISGGVVTGVTFPVAGTGYTYPALVISDPTGAGSGASATLTLDNSMIFTTSAPVFAPTDVGRVLRMGGGIAEITSYVNGSAIVGNMLTPIIDVIADAGNTPRKQTSGNWTLTTPVSTVRGLTHLVGATVTGLADGNVISPRTVAADGSITLDTPATSVTVGLGFTAQVQTLYADAGEPTVQGRRKKVAAVTARMQASRDIDVGCNQPDGAAQSPPQNAPDWGAGNTMQRAQNKARRSYNGLCDPLFTGDTRVPLVGGFDTKGQVAIQQTNPLPLQVLALINEYDEGDRPELKASTRQPNRGRQEE